MTTLGRSLALTAARVPADSAVVEGERRLTYAELDARVNQVARALQDLGLAKGDRCALVSGNSTEYIVLLFAVTRLGAIFVPVNPRSAPPEIGHIVADSGSAIVVSEPTTIGAVQQADLGPARHVTLGAHDDVADLLALADTQSGDQVPDEVTATDDALIIYTSGTTGLAKGALMDHERLMWTGVSVSLATAGITEGSSLIHVAPMYHSGQLVLMVIAGVNLGAKHVVLSQFDPVQVLETMAREKVNAFFGVPTMYQVMLDVQAKLQVDLSSWTAGFYGAAPMPAATAARIQSELPHARIYSFYGQTEAGPNGIFSRPEEVAARPDVTGYRAAPMMAVRIVDQEGRDVEPGGVGEVLLQGACVMKGYWNNPTATAETIRDGWLHTGDLARLDEDGAMTIVDRLKDMIISGGRNIYSAEVELAVMSHPAVVDCAVIGRPHEQFGESVVAVVTLAEGAALTLDELREHCAARIADYKLPRELVVTAIPRNPSGKILKRQLRETLT